MSNTETLKKLERLEKLMKNRWCKDRVTDGRGNYCLLGGIAAVEVTSYWISVIETPLGSEIGKTRDKSKRFKDKRFAEINDTMGQKAVLQLLKLVKDKLKKRIKNGKL